MGVRFFRSFFVAVLAVASANSLGAAAPQADAVRVILVGDSTMATRTGYGDALCGRFQANVTCINVARGGRSSASFRAEGLWDQVRETLRSGGTYRMTVVLIQFGHNDQPGKPGRSTDLVTEFPVNIARYVDDVKNLGAVPVLVTPLTRRVFRNGELQNDLRPWAEATRRIADAKKTPLIDLNQKSAAAVSLMGSAEADTLAEEPPPTPGATTPKPAENVNAGPNAVAKSRFDYTHLGPKGATFFARMVADDLALAVPPLAVHLRTEVSSATRPQLTAAQANAYTYAEVLKHTGRAGSEIVDAWDPLSDPLATGVALRPDYVVDAIASANGKTIFNTVQSAVSRAVTDRTRSASRDRVVILVKPGIYRELLYVPAMSARITLVGSDANAINTRITANLDALVSGSQYAQAFGGQFVATDPAITAMHHSLKNRATVGTPGSAVAWIRNDGFQAKNLTFENTYNKAHGDAFTASGAAAIHSQAVAMLVDDADKVQFENVRFLSFQDTLYLKSSAPAKTVRSFFNRAYIEGDMDFIFGEGTAYFHQSEIKSLGDRRISYVIASSAHLHSKFGFVFNACRFTHDGSPNALAGNFKLVRQWFRGQRCTPYGTITSSPGYACRLGTSDTYEAPAGTISKGVLETVGKVVILNSTIGAHIDRASPWADWNANGTIKHRPVQFSSDDFWDKLIAAGIDPVRQLGYAARKQPAEPFLAEFNNTHE